MFTDPSDTSSPPFPPNLRRKGEAPRPRRNGPAPLPQAGRAVFNAGSAEELGSMSFEPRTKPASRVYDLDEALDFDSFSVDLS